MLICRIINGGTPWGRHAGAKEQQMMRVPVTFVLIFLSTIPAMAHPGPADTTGFLSGLFHPLSGIDHVLAMLALGAWAAMLGGRALWHLPLAFVAGAAMGATLAHLHFALPLTEPLILASVLFLGLFALVRLKLHGALAAALVFGLAIAHGFAHAAELPAGLPLLAPGLGFLAGSALLILAGIALAGGLRRYRTSSTEVRAPRTTS
jgi:urease accessory protein